MIEDSRQLQRVEELFDRVLRLPRAEWGSALDDLCAGDAELRREVGSLLEHADGDAEGLDVTLSLQEYAAETTPDSNIGRRIGPYQIERRIGVGGMGNVYAALQTEPVRRTVALKLIK